MIAMSDLPQIRRLPEKTTLVVGKESGDCKFFAFKGHQREIEILAVLTCSIKF